MRRDAVGRVGYGLVNLPGGRTLLAVMGTHRDLLAWQEAMKLVAEVYRHTSAYPREELYGLVSQTRRAAVSIPSNIAEGSGRNSSRELLQFLGYASGSLSELETELEIGVMLNYLPPVPDVLKQAHRVGRLLRALRSSIGSALST